VLPDGAATASRCAGEEFHIELNLLGSNQADMFFTTPKQINIFFN